MSDPLLDVQLINSRCDL